MDKRNEAAREVTRDANKRDSEGVETVPIKSIPGKQHLGGKRDVNKVGKKQRDFEGIEELRNAKNIRDFEGIEEKTRDAKGVRDFEGLEILGRNTRDFEGIEERKGALKDKREEGKRK